MEMSVITVERFASTDTPALARSLLGRWLVLRQGESLVRRQITETEAYHGPEDRASHACRGLTPRTQVMFGGPGRWYVYLCYGVHEMLNLVTGPEGYPAAILIRGVEGYAGPGRLTRGLGIDRRWNAMEAATASGLWLEDDGMVVSDDEVRVTPRVGVDYAGPEWALKPWRFVWAPAGAAVLGRALKVPRRVRTLSAGAILPAKGRERPA